VLQPQPDGVILNRVKWRELPLSLRRRVLRQVIEEAVAGQAELSFGVLERARLLAETGTTGQQTALPGGIQLTVGYEGIRIAAASPPVLIPFPQLPDDQPIPLPVPGAIALLNGWSIHTEPVHPVNWDEIRHNPDPWQAFVGMAEGEQLWLRPRRPGERIQPLGLQGHSQPLKKVMNERQIPTPVRGRWPILATTQHPLWLVGHTLDHRAQVLKSSQRVIRVRAFMRY
jgi:tRNA(Ile)-lysidine synthase